MAAIRRKVSPPRCLHRLKTYYAYIWFILRSEVMKLYRSMLRMTYQVENIDQRKELQRWIRHDFDQNKHHTDEDVIRMMITKGKLSLRELEQAVQLAK